MAGADGGRVRLRLVAGRLAAPVSSGLGARERAVAGDGVVAAAPPPARAAVESGLHAAVRVRRRARDRFALHLRRSAVRRVVARAAWGTRRRTRPWRSAVWCSRRRHSGSASFSTGRSGPTDAGHSSGIAGALGSFSGSSVMVASVISSTPATETAFSSAMRATLVGSMILRRYGRRRAQQRPSAAGAIRLASTAWRCTPR